MIKENRYCVLKIRDIDKYLTKEEKEILNTLASKVTLGRDGDKKRPHKCVVVDDDWPMYEAVWSCIEAWEDYKTVEHAKLNVRKYLEG